MICILIVSSDTGGGHRSAALALTESFQRLFPVCQVKTVRLLEEATWPSRWMAGLYNFLLRYWQPGMVYYYKLIEWTRPNEAQGLFAWAWRVYGKALFAQFQPDVVVSVHPMTQHVVAYFLAQAQLKHIPLLTVVTDPYDRFWQGWACRSVQRYFVASRAAQAQLVAYGVPEQRIVETGMPVSERFVPVSPVEKQALRQALGLQPEAFVVLFNAGWVGGGNIFSIFQTLLKQMACQLPQKNTLQPIQLVFLAGKNEALLKQARHMFQPDVNIKLCGFMADMHRWMQAADVMVSKLGGLTTFEAAACRLPMIADVTTPPMPQEAQTAYYFDKNGAGWLLKQREALWPLLQTLMNAPQQVAMCQQRLAAQHPLGASSRIAEAVASLGPLPQDPTVNR